jgi:DNA modification methylase
MNPDIAAVLAGERQWCVVTGDCRDILPTLPDKSVDAVVTDPPYGVGFKYDSYDDTRENWFALMDAVMPQVRRSARFVVLPSCQVKLLGWWYHHHCPEWQIVWCKGSPWHVSTIGFNDYEPLLTWGKPMKPMHDHFYARCEDFQTDGHPCPKSVEWARWLVSRSTNPGAIVLDPFAGSFTTGVACVELGRRFIGVEVSPAYCDVGRARLKAAEAQGQLFASSPPTVVDDGDLYAQHE